MIFDSPKHIRIISIHHSNRFDASVQIPFEDLDSFHLIDDSEPLVSIRLKIF